MSEQDAGVVGKRLATAATIAAVAAPILAFLTGISYVIGALGKLPVGH